MKILTHPSNVDLIRKMCGDAFEQNLFYGIEIIANSYLDRDKWTGKYILPDGRAVPKEEVRVPEGRFFEWGNSDFEIKMLLAWGLLKKQMEPLFYTVKDFSFDFPMMTVPKFLHSIW